MNWKDNFKEGKEIVLATCSQDGQPNANIVISLGFVGNKMLIANCQMKNTIKNLGENKKIVVIGGYYRVVGTVDLLTSGKYFDLCVKKSKGYNVKHAILVNIKRVFDLDNNKIVLNRTT